MVLSTLSSMVTIYLLDSKLLQSEDIDSFLQETQIL